MDSFKFETEENLMEAIKVEAEDDSDMIGCDQINQLMSVIDVDCSYISPDCFYETDMLYDDFNLESPDTFDDFSNIENDPTFCTTNPDGTNFSKTGMVLSQLNGNGSLIDDTKDGILNLCNICDQGFPSKNELKLHYNEEHNTIFCLKCDEGFNDVNLYEAHLERHGTESICDVCQKRFSCEKAMIFHHKTIHLGIKPQKCPYCNFRSRYIRNLKLHVDRHEKNTRFKCAECYKEYYRKWDLDCHVVSVHGPGIKCELCGKVFGYRSNLLLHKRNSHSNNSVTDTHFKCDFCDENILYRHDFEEHIMNHLGILKSKFDDGSKIVKKFPCDFCSKIMPDRGSFEKHIMKHLGIMKRKRYRCKFCKFKTSHRKSLKKHEKWHTSKKYFACDICKKNFLLLESLKKHQKNHERKKRHLRNRGSEILTDQDSLKGHRHDRTVGKNLKCGKCDEIFFDPFSLKMHMTTKH